MVLLGMVFLSPLYAVGQSINSPVIITWQANNYFPANYQGRAMITPNSLIVASVELIQNGKLSDLTNANIQWYVNGIPTDGGVGFKTTSFIAKPQTDGYVTIKASVTIGGSEYDNSYRVQTAQPVIIINTQNSENSVPAGSQSTISASPYFFNISSLDDLSFFWSVNGQTVTGNNNQVTINVGTPSSGYQGSIQISVTAQNKNFQYELVKQTTNLSITQ